MEAIKVDVFRGCSHIFRAVSYIRYKGNTQKVSKRTYVPSCLTIIFKSYYFRRLIKIAFWVGTIPSAFSNFPNPFRSKSQLKEMGGTFLFEFHETRHYRLNIAVFMHPYGITFLSLPLSRSINNRRRQFCVFNFVKSPTVLFVQGGPLKTVRANFDHLTSILQKTFKYGNFGFKG